MASSTFQTTQYPSNLFVESAGAILFDLSRTPPRVCLIHHNPKAEYLLAKGRRNQGESRAHAALREAREETGYECRLHPVSMPTRAPCPNEPGDVLDVARVRSGLTEPFMMTVRELGEGKGVKVIWWYVAEVVAVDKPGEGEQVFAPEFFEYDEALRKLTFKKDRDVLSTAISLVRGEYD